MNNKTKYIIGGGIVLVVIIGIVFFNRRTPSPKAENTPVQEQASSTTDSAAPSTATTVKATSTNPTKPAATSPAAKVAPSKPASESYTDALAKYRKSGYYIQFYPCQATPGSLIVKQGSRVMLDNRDSKAHEIAFKSQHFRVGAYNFAVAVFGTIGTNYVTCDGGGSAVVTVVP